MIRFVREVSRRSYYSKSRYFYRIIRLTIPKKFHEKVEEWLGKDLEVDLIELGSK